MPFFLAVCLVLFAAHVRAQGTAATYQGRLNVAGAAANGSFDITFTPYTTNIGGSPQITLTNLAVQVTNGLFTTTLDFGGVPSGQRMWLELGVRTNGGGGFTTLSPRQPLAPTPYALFANTASNLVGSVAAGQISGAISSAGLNGTYANALTLNNAGNNISGAFNGNGANVTNVNAAQLNGLNASNFWQLGGNRVAAGQVLGSTNNVPLELVVNGARAFRFEPNAAGAPNIVGGSTNNYSAPGLDTVVIGGGNYNVVSNSSSTIAGGSYNLAAGYTSTVGGGIENSSTGTSATIAGGVGNTASGFESTVGGGEGNSATNAYTVVAGGAANVSGGLAATVGGGLNNIANGRSATIAGGENNLANGRGSVASGQNAQALHDGAFVSADNQGGVFNSTATNQFLIRAGGGVGINTNNPQSALHVRGTVTADGFAGSGAALTGVGSSALAPGAALANLQAGGQYAVPSGGVILSSNSSDANLATAGYVRLNSLDLGSAWAQKNDSLAPTFFPRSYPASVWTGSEMLIWGGTTNYPAPVSNGLRFNLASNTWSAISSVNEPAAQYLPISIWTGTEMLVLGGYPATANGARYNPAANSWNSIPPPPISITYGYLFGTNAVFFGGTFSNNVLVVTGAVFSLSQYTWTTLKMTNAPYFRSSAATAWNGEDFLIWGGSFYTNPVSYPTNFIVLSDGWRYNLASNKWTALSSSGAPSPRTLVSSGWSGSEFYVMGGFYTTNSFGTATALTNGFRYNLVSNSWTGMASNGSPFTTLQTYSCVWSGDRLLLWGNASDPGWIYFPTNNTWSKMSTNGLPYATAGVFPLWTGTEMLVWGGNSITKGGRYNASSNSWLTIPNRVIPGIFPSAIGIWTGIEMLVLNNYSGARFNPNANAWSTLNFVNLGNYVSSRSIVWSGSELLFWGGTDGANYFNDGIRFSPLSETWVSINSTNAPSARSGHSAVWTGTEMLIWGGNNTTNLNSGGRYNPSSNTWATMSTVNAPTARTGQAAVWTGTELLVWGGITNGISAGDGAKYSPATDTWTPISSTGAPSARSGHTAIWTGTEMIVWGGYNNGYLNTGARYNPSSNTWTPMTTSGPPAGRQNHSVVWTGTEMIVWGGYNGSYLNDGMRYSPTANEWIAMPLANAPPARANHAAVWDGTQMLIWGGTGNSGSDLGGVYSFRPGSNMYLYLHP